MNSTLHMYLHFIFAQLFELGKELSVYLFIASQFSFLYVAAQMWCLARFLPLMIGEQVPENDRKWRNYLLLLEIVDYLFAPVLSQHVVAYLSVIIEEHQGFIKLYSECSVTPKIHYMMIHYPEWISRCIYHYVFVHKFHVCYNLQVWPISELLVHAL